MLDPDSVWNDPNASLAPLWDVPDSDKLGASVSKAIKECLYEIDEDGTYAVEVPEGYFEFGFFANDEWRGHEHTYSRIPLNAHEVWRKAEGGRAQPSDQARHNAIRGILSVRDNRCFFIVEMVPQDFTVRYRMVYRMLEHWIEFRFTIARDKLLAFGSTSAEALRTAVAREMLPMVQEGVQRALGELTGPVKSLWMDATFQALSDVEGMQVGSGNDTLLPRGYKPIVIAVPVESDYIDVADHQWKPVHPVARVSDGGRKIDV